MSRQTIFEDQTTMPPEDGPQTPIHTALNYEESVRVGPFPRKLDTDRSVEHVERPRRGHAY